MITLLNEYTLLFFLIGLIFGIICTLFFLILIDTRGTTPKYNFSYISNEEEDRSFMLEEWKITVESQRHFSSLLLNFRTIVISVALGAATLTVKFAENLGSKQIKYLILIFCVFWITCFIMDFFYYLRMLMGAVKHAEKFDNSNYFRKIGFFGLNRKINSFAKPKYSKLLVILFYSFYINDYSLYNPIK